jgi:hypothetical protein
MIQKNNMIAILIIVGIIWGWIIYELYYAPTFDENGMPIDIKKEDIEEDLWDKNHIEDMDK